MRILFTILFTKISIKLGSKSIAKLLKLVCLGQLRSNALSSIINQELCNLGSNRRIGKFFSILKSILYNVFNTNFKNLIQKIHKTKNFSIWDFFYALVDYTGIENENVY